MVKRASKVCGGLNCVEIVSGPERYCLECLRKQRSLDNKRRGSQRKTYDAEWERIRAHHLEEFPNCVDCGVPGFHVDHEIPIKKGGTHDYNNLKTRCHSCHSRKTAKFDGGFGNPIKRIIDKG